MSDYYYLDLKLNIRHPDQVVLTPSFVRGSIESSLESFFGEIGGKTQLEVIKFSPKHKRAIFRVPEEFLQRTRTAITLIGHYQEVPCHFQVLNSSKEPLDFDKEAESEED